MAGPPVAQAVTPEEEALRLAIDAFDRFGVPYCLRSLVVELLAEWSVDDVQAG